MLNSVGYSYGAGKRWSGDPRERGGARRGRGRSDDNGSGSRLSVGGEDGNGRSGSGVGGHTDGRYSGPGSGGGGGGGGSHGDGRLASRSGREHVIVSYCCVWHAQILNLERAIISYL